MTKKIAENARLLRFFKSMFSSHGYGLTVIGVRALTDTYHRPKSSIKRYQVFHNCCKRWNMGSKVPPNLSVCYSCFPWFLSVLWYLCQRMGTARAQTSRSILMNQGDVAPGATVLLIGCMASLRKQPIGWLFLYPGTWYSHRPIGSIYTLGATSAESKGLTDKNGEIIKEWEREKYVIFFTLLFTSTSLFENKMNHIWYLLKGLILSIRMYQRLTYCYQVNQGVRFIPVSSVNRWPLQVLIHSSNNIYW